MPPRGPDRDAWYFLWIVALVLMVAVDALIRSVA